jgi:hypothetical protein
MNGIGSVTSKCDPDGVRLHPDTSILMLHAFTPSQLVARTQPVQVGTAQHGDPHISKMRHWVECMMEGRILFVSFLYRHVGAWYGLRLAKRPPG